MSAVAPISHQQAAIDLAAEGFRVFPCAAGSKRPRPDMTSWPTRATTDPDIIRDWFSDGPRSNIGIATGTGLLVIDLDVKAGADGVAAFQELAAPFGGAPKTRLAVTPSGGRHAYYKTPDNVAIRNSTGQLAAGIDVRGDGGYAVAPPSYFEGRRYQWANDLEVADAPAWLLELVADRPKADARTKPKARHGLNVDDIRGMLVHIRGDDYESWCRALWALAGSQREDLELLDLAVEWSANQMSFEGPGDVAAKFAEADGRLGVGTLWSLAETGGWRPTAEQRARLQPPTDPIEEFEDLGPLPGRFAVLTATEFAGTLKPRQWRVKSLLLADAELTLLVGDSGAGKSFLALDLAAAINAGRPFGGRPTLRGRVVYVCAEGAGDFRFRMHAMARHHGLALDALPAVVPAAPSLDQPADADALIKSIVAAGGADFVVLDTLSATAPGLDQNADMPRYVAACQLIGARLRAQVLVIHHVGKDPSKGPRGGSSLKAAADTVLTIERSGDVRTATVSKSKGSEDGARFAFRLVPVGLGLDEDGKTYGSCIVAHVDPSDVRPARAEPQGRWQRAVVAVCSVEPRQQRDIVDDVLAAQPLDRGDAAEVKNARRAIRRALQELTDRKLLHIHADGGIATTSAVAGDPI